MVSRAVAVFSALLLTAALCPASTGGPAASKPAQKRGPAGAPKKPGPPAAPAPQQPQSPAAAPADAAAQGAANESEAIVRAEQALDKKDYPAAITTLKEVAARNTTNYRVYFDLAFAYTMTAERAAAIEAYRKALELHPDLPQANLNLAILLLEDKQPAEAETLLQKAVAARPRDARALALLGDALEQLGNRTDAASVYRKAIELDPALLPAHLGLARVLEAGKQYAEAEKHLRKVAELQPGEAGPRLEIGALLEASGRSDEARAVYAEAADKHPDNAEAKRRLARLLLAAKQYEAAAVQLEPVVKISGLAADELALARAYIGSKRPADAIPLLRKLAAAQPGNYDVRLLLGEALMGQRELPAAQQELQAAVSLRPDVPDAYVDLANVLYLQQNYPATLGVLDRLAQMHRETPWLDFLRAISLDKLGQVEAAHESYQKFLSISQGRYPDQEFQARQRTKALQLAMEKKGITRRKR